MPNQVDPHAEGKVLTSGPSPENAVATIVLIHGRGASASGMLPIVDALGVSNVAAIAPQAVGNTWYPHSFLAPMDANQPYLNSALAKVESVVADLLDRGVPSEKIALLGFSQGACLASEFVARHPRKYGAVMILTGGVIGPPGTPRNYTGDLAETPVFIGSGDPDPHVPWERVLETEAVLKGLGGDVEVRRYPGRPHTISQDEIDACRALMQKVTR